MSDPGIDIEATLKQLDAMVAEVNAGWRLANASSLDKLNALRTYLYKAGIWNGHQPFRYDLDDPLGRVLRNKLLPTYLATRKGNCASMSLLFIILGHKLGIDVTASLAPEHIFVKYRDDMGNRFNLETTHEAAPKQDASYQRDTPMTPESLANGLYLRALSKRETAAVMMGTLMEFYGETGQHDRHIALAGMVLEYYPNDVHAMLRIGRAFYLVLNEVFLSKYPAPRDIPLEGRPYFEYLSLNNQGWFAKAEALGWREPDKAANTAYLETVQRAKERLRDAVG